MAKEGDPSQGWNSYMDLSPKKLKRVYVETPDGEVVGPLKVVGPVKLVHSPEGSIVEKQIRGYGPNTPPQGSGWMVYKEIHLKPGNRLQS